MVVGAVPPYWVGPLPLLRSLWACSGRDAPRRTPCAHPWWRALEPLRAVMRIGASGNSTVRQAVAESILIRCLHHTPFFAHALRRTKHTPMAARAYTVRADAGHHQEYVLGE